MVDPIIYKQSYWCRLIDHGLIIFSDAAKDVRSQNSVEEVRSYLKTIRGFTKIEIIERTNNFGLAKSIISGVTYVVNKYGRVIVLEDDLVTSPYFLIYMNKALDIYKNDDMVASIHGYIYPVKKALPETFFLRGADCWGWATWKRAWDHFEQDGKKLLDEIQKQDIEKEFDLDGSYPYTAMLEKQVSGKNNSWAIRWYASAFLKNMLTLYPGISLVNNIGHDKTGVHGTQAKFYETKISTREIRIGGIKIKENPDAKAIIAEYFRSLKPPFWKRILRKARTWA